MKNSLLFSLIVYIMLYFISPALAQEDQGHYPNDIVKISHTLHYYADGQSVIAYKLHIRNGWYVYNQDKAELGRPFIIKLDGSNLLDYRVEWPPAESLTKNFEHQSLVSHIFRNEVIIPIELHLKEGSSLVHVKMHYGVCDDQTCIPASFEEDITIQPSPIAAPSEAIHYTYMILFALLGGLLMNLMPCVLPIIGLKVYSVLNTTSQNRASIHLNLLATAFGILTTFWCIALLTIALSAMGRQVFWGMHFQSPGFLVLLVLLLSSMVSNLLGYYEIQVPQRLAQKLNILPMQSKALEHFFVGVIATIMATPCLAPFLATAIAYAINKEAYDIMLIYTTIGLGMAAPFLILASKPKLITYLPKPGMWMYWIKWAFAIVLLLASIWLLTVLSTTISIAGALQVAVGCVILNFALVQNFDPTYRWLKAILISTAIVIAFIAPWINYIGVHDSNTPPTIQELSAERIPNGWVPYDESKLQAALNSGHTVLLNVGAQWCLTCKWNKRFVLDSSIVQDAIHQKKVVQMYADYTDYSEPISQLLKRYSSYGVPTTIIYGPEAKGGILLPTLLSQDEVLSAICIAMGKSPA